MAKSYYQNNVDFFVNIWKRQKRENYEKRQDVRFLFVPFKKSDISMWTRSYILGRKNISQIFATLLSTLQSSQTAKVNYVETLSLCIRRSVDHLFIIYIYMCKISFADINFHKKFAAKTLLHRNKITSLLLGIYIQC